MAYLDNTGVAYLWGKIKSYVTGQVPSSVGELSPLYGTCTTAAKTAAKTTTISGVTELTTGLTIHVRFTNANGVANPTLQVNSLTAKAIVRYGTTVPSTSAASSWNAGSVVSLTYDGTYWVMNDWNNTTYSAMSEAEMQTGTATTARNITAARLKAAVEYHAPVTSVNGSTGAVTVYVPTTISSFTNDSNYVTSADVEELLGTLKIYATDATSKAVVDQAFGTDVLVVYPSTITNDLMLTGSLEPRTWFAWMNGTELELARLDGSLNTSTSAMTLYLRGRTSIATGTMGVDSAWTVSALASDAEGVAY